MVLFRGFLSCQRRRTATLHRLPELTTLAQDLMMSNPGFFAQLTDEDRLVGLSLIMTLSGIILGAILSNPNFLGMTAVLVILVLILGWFPTRSTRLAWLLVFGLIAGILELWSDWVHVTQIHSLVYTDYFGFKLLASPSYMPIGWWLTVVQFGYLALRLNERWPSWVSIGVVTLLGTSIPPWYEEFAASAKAWFYPPSGMMVSNTPLWVIFTYGGCMFGIATMALINYRPQAWGRAIIGGIFAGASFMLSGVFWYAILG
jgi:hypothetical protein